MAHTVSTLTDEMDRNKGLSITLEEISFTFPIAGMQTNCLTFLSCSDRSVKRK